MNQQKEGGSDKKLSGIADRGVSLFYSFYFINYVYVFVYMDACAYVCLYAYVCIFV